MTEEMERESGVEAIEQLVRSEEEERAHSHHSHHSHHGHHHHKHHHSHHKHRRKHSSKKGEKLKKWWKRFSAKAYKKKKTIIGVSVTIIVLVFAAAIAAEIIRNGEKELQNLTARVESGWSQTIKQEELTGTVEGWQASDVIPFSFSVKNEEQSVLRIQESLTLKVTAAADSPLAVKQQEDAKILLRDHEGQVLETVEDRFALTSGGYVVTYVLPETLLHKEDGKVLRSYSLYIDPYTLSNYQGADIEILVRVDAHAQKKSDIIPENALSGKATLWRKLYFKGTMGQMDIQTRLPNHWKDHAQEKVATINKLMAGSEDKASFLWYSDAHWQQSYKISPSLLKYISANTYIDKTVFGGDLATSGNELESLMEWREAVRDVENHHSVIGNHDNESPMLPSEEARYDFLIAPERTPDMVQPEGALYYYIDNEQEKTRYLYLSTGRMWVMEDELRFVADSLNSTPAGWRVVVLSHIWFQYEDTAAPTVGSVPDYCRELMRMFDRYNARESGVNPLCMVPYDFTNGQGEVVLCVGGHTHTDYDFRTEGGIAVMLMETDSYQVRANSLAVRQTTMEAAVSAVIVDYDAQVVRVVRVGRGEDRIFPLYAEKKEK